MQFARPRRYQSIKYVSQTQLCKLRVDLRVKDVPSEVQRKPVVAGSATPAAWAWPRCSRFCPRFQRRRAQAGWGFHFLESVLSACCPWISARQMLGRLRPVHFAMAALGGRRCLTQAPHARFAHDRSGRLIFGLREGCFLPHGRRRTGAPPPRRLRRRAEGAGQRLPGGAR